MAALHLLAAQSTQLPRAVAPPPAPSSRSPSPPPSVTAVVTPAYPYSSGTSHPLLNGSLRRGKWTPEEETYAAAIIQYFLSGVLPIQYGTTLRGYIAQLLHCDPMRVSKKLIPGSVFVGVRIDPKIGRRSYYPCPADTPDLDGHKQRAENQLEQLRMQFIESIEREEQQEQAAIHPQRATPPPPTVTRVQPSPPKRKRDEQEPTPEPARYQQHLRASLPSLTQALRKNRPPALTAPAQGVDHHHGYTAPLPSASMHYPYTSPSAVSKWPSPSFRHSQLPTLPHLGSATYPPPPPPYKPVP